MSNKKFTVCLPFKNEKDEVGKTCKSIRDTAGDRVDIVVLNDCSDDGYDYKSDLEPYNVQYYESDYRLGSSAGKELCVQYAQTPYFLILDAHCRIYTENWLDLAIELMERPESKNTVYCCACWYFNNDDDHQSSHHMKAFGGFWDYNIKSIFSCGWNLTNFAKDDNDEPFEIPCILGANYICSKEWWNTIKGYQGLRLYGREETFISLKSRLAGGSVKCFPKICTGHKTRPNNVQPYACYCYEVLHNEMVIAHICAPHQKENLHKIWQKIFSFDPTIYAFAIDLYSSHLDELDALKSDLDSIKVLDYKDIDKYNARFQKSINFSYKSLKAQNEGTYAKWSDDNKKVRFNVG